MSIFAWKVAWDVHTECRVRKGSVFFPQAIANALGITRAEAELALWYLRTENIVRKRRDGRWYLVMTN